MWRMPVCCAWRFEVPEYSVLLLYTLAYLSLRPKQGSAFLYLSKLQWRWPRPEMSIWYRSKTCARHSAAAHVAFAYGDVPIL